MRLLILSFSMLCWSPGVWAVEPMETSETVQSAEPTIQSLSERLVAAEATGVLAAAEIARLKMLLSNGTTLVDLNRTLEERIAAARVLTELGDPATFPFLYAASRSERAALRREVIALAPQWETDAAVALLHERVRREFGDGGAMRRQLALDGLTAIASETAAGALWEIASNPLILRSTRDQARSILSEHYSAYVEQRGGLPTEKNDFVGGGSAMLGSAITGGVLLSSVGTWGKSEAGATVGALGGAAIGAGTAALYMRSNTVPRGAGLRYASNVLWGVTGAGLTNSVLDVDDADIAALVRTGGVSVGALTGYSRMKHQPTEGSVFETNFGGILGLHLGNMIPAVAMPQTDNGPEDERLARFQSTGALVGGTVGLGLSTLVQEAWVPDIEDGLFSGLMAVEGSILVGTIPARHGLRNRDEDAYGHLGFNLGLTSGLVLTHFVEIPVVTTQVAATGAVIGHVVGDAVAKFDPQKYNNSNLGAQISVPAGLAGTAIGAVAAPGLSPTTADAAAIGVGTLLMSLQTGAVSYYLYEKKVLSDYQPEAITQLAGSATAVSLLALSPRLEVAPSQSIFLLSGASWGAWYGALGQMVVPNEMTDAETVLLVTTTADVGVGATALLSSKAVGINPEDTFVPQLFGVAGGTVGALAVMLATESTRSIAGGALVGSTLGLGAGAFLGPKLRKSAQSQPLQNHRLAQAKKKPGHWSFIALPNLGSEGEWGGQFQLQGVGL